MKEVDIPVKEFIDEHKKLVDFLKNPTDKVRREEYLDQSKELREVEDKLKSAAQWLSKY